MEDPMALTLCRKIVHVRKEPESDYQNILQKSVSEIIEIRKLIEAKNQLIHANKTVSEIGYDLGYNEKAYFSNVFKKKSGQTPTEFREEMRKQLVS